MTIYGNAPFSMNCFLGGRISLVPRPPLAFFSATVEAARGGLGTRLGKDKVMPCFSKGQYTNSICGSPK